MDSGRLQAAIWGGVFLGVLSGLPFVKYGNACCCLWVVAGGVLAVWLAQKNDPRPVTAADGLLLGLVAGAVGTAVALPFDLVFGDLERGMMLRWVESAGGNVPPEAREMLERGGGAAARAFGFLVALCINVVFAMLGGLLGVAIFKKSAPPPPPPPTVIPHDPGMAH